MAKTLQSQCLAPMSGSLVRELDPTCCNMWLIHVDVWHKPAQYCEPINPCIKHFKKRIKFWGDAKGQIYDSTRMKYLE